MARPLWQLLMEDTSDLTCDECCAVMDYYAEVLARGGAALLPKVIEYLNRRPHCAFQQREVLRRLAPSQSDRGAASLPGLAGSDGSDTKSKWLP